MHDWLLIQTSGWPCSPGSTLSDRPSTSGGRSPPCCRSCACSPRPSQSASCTKGTALMGCKKTLIISTYPKVRKGSKITNIYFLNCQAQAPKPQSPKPKTKGPWADTKIFF